MIKSLLYLFFALLFLYTTGCTRNGSADAASEPLNPSQTPSQDSSKGQNRHLLPVEERRLKYQWDHEEEDFAQRIQKAVKWIKKYDRKSSGEIDDGCLRFGEWHLIVLKPEDRNKGILDLDPEYQHSRAYVVDLYHNQVIPKNGWKDAHPLYDNLVTYYKENQQNIDQSFYNAVAQITSAIAFHHNAFVSLDDPHGEAFKKPRMMKHHHDTIFDYYVLDNHEMKHYQLLISHDRIQFDLLSSQPWPVKP